MQRSAVGAEISGDSKPTESARMKDSTRTRLRGKIRQLKGKGQQIAGKIEDEAGKIQQRREKHEERNK
jgi:hypothetical protein